MFTKSERSTFSYWFAHWCSFQMTALNCKKWKFKYLFHDWEKPWLRLFLPYSKVQKLHRAYHKHHPEWLERQLYRGIPVKDEKWFIEKLLNIFDYEAAIIDWECSRFTKESAQLNAHDEYKRLLSFDTFKEKYPWITKYCYNEFSKRLYNAIKKLNLENKI